MAKKANKSYALVIVESPAKARTIEGYLGEGYVVESSVGHIRDLPSSAREIPATVSNQPWARLGVNVDDDFAPSSSSTSGTKRERKTPTKANREAIEELYDASRWLLRSTPRDGREAVRLLKMAERMLWDDDDEKGEFLDDRERKEIRIAKEKIERAIKLVKR